jgi:hypothetical protein
MQRRTDQNAVATRARQSLDVTHIAHSAAGDELDSGARPPDTLNQEKIGTCAATHPGEVEENQGLDAAAHHVARNCRGLETNKCGGCGRDESSVAEIEAKDYPWRTNCLDDVPERPQRREGLEPNDDARGARHQDDSCSIDGRDAGIDHERESHRCDGIQTFRQFAAMRDPVQISDIYFRETESIPVCSGQCDRVAKLVLGHEHTPDRLVQFPRAAASVNRFPAF